MRQQGINTSTESKINTGQVNTIGQQTTERTRVRTKQRHCKQKPVSTGL